MLNFAENYSLYSPPQHCMRHIIHLQKFGLLKFNEALKHAFYLAPASIHLYLEDKPTWRIQESAKCLLFSPFGFSNLEVTIQYIQTHQLKTNVPKSFKNHKIHKRISRVLFIYLLSMHYNTSLQVVSEKNRCRQASPHLQLAGSVLCELMISFCTFQGHFLL